MIKVFGLIVLALGTYYAIKKIFGQSKWSRPEKKFPKNWRILLSKNVNFYNSLSQEEKDLFEYKILEFLQNVRIIGIKTRIDEKDRLLVASSAVIPIFSFPNWQYLNLDEVLVYPKSFNDRFETEGEGDSILGMVGTGSMEGKMILSKQALELGFQNERDRNNTAIHEFVHLIDKMDGNIDGVPSLLLERPYVIPWMKLMEEKINEIYENNSEINPYGATNKTEFFAVISEYFFERPKLLKQKHPELYKYLSEIFDQNLAHKNLKRKKNQIGRNDPCPCGSKTKFKKCCGKLN